MNMIQKIALVFTIIGAINWGLIGLFNFNLVEAVFGDALLSATSRSISALQMLLQSRTRKRSMWYAIRTLH